ncbi:MAG TPA: hypothetical protein VII06_25565 [Chloroflexota bacterium]|jgi:hypothetical protein
MLPADPPTGYALGCHVAVPPEHPMCAAHWALVPLAVQELVRGQWRPGWRGPGWPRYKWAAALDAATLRVARAEGRLG